MTPRTQAMLVGGITGLAAWVGWFVLYAKRKQPALEALGAQLGPVIAEDAAKQYLAQRYGLTPAVMQSIRNRTGLITNVIDAIRR